MSPATFSAQMVGKISLFRGNPCVAASTYAKHLHSVHLLRLGEGRASVDALVVERPGDVSDRILVALFGHWPAVDLMPRRHVSRVPRGVSVTFVDWSEWDCCVAAQSGSVEFTAKSVSP